MNEDLKTQQGELITRRDDGVVLDAYASAIVDSGSLVLLVQGIEFPVPVILLPKAIEPGATVRFSLSLVKRPAPEEVERLKAEASAQLKAEADAQLKAEADAQRQGEEAARLKAELESKLRTEIESQLRAEAEERRQAQEEALKQESGNRRKR